jgi:hypothetical protein
MEYSELLKGSPFRDPWHLMKKSTKEISKKYNYIMGEVKLCFPL